MNILEYISQFAEFEEKNGEHWALSPLKNENTPSFSVNTEMNSFFDFSSGRGGNILTFIRCYFECDKRKAEEILQSYAGVNGVVPGKRKMETVRVVNRFTRRQKRVKEPKSEILSDNYMERYEKRPDKLAIWEAEGISRVSIDKFQVYYDSFSDRLVYPVRSLDGKIINVSGRTVDEQWKEKGLRKYTYFKPLGTLNTIYGLHENRESIMEKREVILFEGIKSVMLADTWGINNAAALLTSHLNHHQLKILAKLACRVVFALDKNVFVRDDDNIRRLKRFVTVEYIWDKDGLLDEKDSPVDKGLGMWEKLYERRLSYR